MINSNALKAAMLLAGYSTIAQGAKAIGMPPSTMYRRLNEGVFTNKEMEEMIKTYKISDIVGVFFSEIGAL